MFLAVDVTQWRNGPLCTDIALFLEKREELHARQADELFRSCFHPFSSRAYVPQPTIDEEVGIPATQKKRMDECGMVKSLSLMRGCLEERRKRKKCTRGEARTHDLGFTNETY